MTDELSTMLPTLGFRVMRTQAKPVNYPAPSREQFAKGDVRVISPTKSEPWVTVQKMNSRGTADWFVDFPPEVPVAAVVGFVGGI